MSRQMCERVTRVCRLYHTNTEACAVLRLSAATLVRLCRRYGIEAPDARQLRQRLETTRTQLTERKRA